MFEELNCFNKILVSGPQRSGTTICHRIIVQDLLPYSFTGYDELDFGVNKLDRFKLLYQQNKIIVHCPDVSRHIHLFGKEDTIIIWMKRSIEDIKKSQIRINWQDYNLFEEYGLTRENGRELIAETKYKYWNEFQKQQVSHFKEVEYESLQYHPLWINKEERTLFLPRQWRKENIN